MILSSLCDYYKIMLRRGDVLPQGYSSLPMNYLISLTPEGEIDGILCGVIALHKILEVNSSSYGAPGDFLPDQDILRRYYALGGREVSFASDAHLTWRVAEKREKVVKALRQIGFAFLTVPKAGSHLRVEI